MEKENTLKVATPLLLSRKEKGPTLKSNVSIVCHTAKLHGKFARDYDPLSPNPSDSAKRITKIFACSPRIKYFFTLLKKKKKNAGKAEKEGSCCLPFAYPLRNNFRFTCNETTSHV